MLVSSRQSFALYVLTCPTTPRRPIIDIVTQCAGWRSPILELALSHKRLYQDTSQHCLALCGGLNRAWRTCLRRHPSSQCRLFYFEYCTVHRVLYPNHCAVDLEEGERMDARTVLAWSMGECFFASPIVKKCWTGSTLERNLRNRLCDLDDLHFDCFLLSDDE